MPAERRAILLLLSLAVGGQALRLWRHNPEAPPGQLSLLPAPAGSSPASHRDSSLALTRPLAKGEQVDLDRASALEISRLPRIGLRLAKVIVADREAHGPFGSAEALDRVAGVGPGLIGAIREQVRFSAAAQAPLPAPAAASSSQPLLNLNQATALELERLPRVGPSLAARIVAFREKHGPFPVVDSLVRVPGIGPATLALLRGRVEVR